MKLRSINNSISTSAKPVIFFTVACSIILFGAGLVEAQVAEDLVINEFMIANTKILDEDGDSSDWVEVYNGTAAPIHLGNYYLSDDAGDLKKWKFPEVDLAPGAYELIYASGKDRVPPPYYHSNFKLSEDDGVLVLSNNSGQVVDQIVFGAIPRNISYGRSGVSGGWEYFKELTPAEPNGTPLSPVPQFSMEGGFYSGPVTVALTTDAADAEIFYTLDGRAPTTSSSKYTAPIHVNNTTTIRAVAARPGYQLSPPAGQSYLINFDRKGLPVLVISTEEENLWDPYNGIFPGSGDTSNGPPNLQPKERRPIHVDFFNDEGELGFSQDAQIQVVGNSSRLEMMRPFKLSANEDVDPMNSHFEYPVLQKNIDRFRHLQVRNNNQDGVKQMAYDPAYQLTFLRNTLMADLCRPLKHFDFRDDGGAVLIIINGKNYGFGNIGEKRDNSMISQNHPEIDDDDVDMIVLRDGDFEGWYYRPDMQVGIMDFFDMGIAEYEEVSTAAQLIDGRKGVGDFMELMAYIKGSNLADNSKYAYVKEHLDINDFLTAMSAQIYAANFDYFTNNIAFWREHKVGETPGKFHTSNYDFDANFGLTKPASHNSLAYAYDYFFVLRSLLNNHEFKEAFIRRFDHLLNIAFHPDTAIPIVEELRDRINPWVDFHLRKWAQGNTSYGDWQWNVNLLIEWLQQRPSYMREYVESQFDLSGSSQVTLDVQADGGDIFMKVLEEDVPMVSGKYFNDIPLTIIAKNKPGYRFDGFEVNGQAVAEAQYTFIPTQDTTISVYFSEDADAPVAEIAINELITGGAKKFSDVDGDDSDWIELYNTTSRTIDLSGKYLTDDEEELRKWTFPEGTIIGPNGFLLVIASGKDKVDSLGYLHLNFSLSKDNPEPVLLVDSNGKDILDKISANQTGAIAKDHSGGRFPDGANTFISMALATPGSSNIYIAPPEPGEIVLPADNTILESSDVVFTWDAGSRVEKYQLNIGRGFSIFRTRESGDFIFSGQTTGTSIDAVGIPQDGNDIYVRLWSYIDGTWIGGDIHNYHTVIDAAPVAFAGMALAVGPVVDEVVIEEDVVEEVSEQVAAVETTSEEPVADTTEELIVEISDETVTETAVTQEEAVIDDTSIIVVNGADPMISWEAVQEAESYFLDVATSQDLLAARGEGDVYSQEVGSATSTDLNGIAVTGGILYVKVWTRIDNEWVEGETASVELDEASF